jgi:DNA-binding NtrC family response regulator
MSEKILVVDDEESIRFTFKTFLEDKGYDVSMAAGFEEARALMEAQEFDLVYADVVLVGKSGLDILREVKKRSANCPVIMITGVPTVDTSAEALRNGAFDYIPKPVRQETLLRTTRMALEHKSLLDEREKYRANLEAIFRGIRDAILLVDENMIKVEANEAVKSICGCEREASAGKPYDEMQFCCSAACVSVVEETILTKKPVDAKRVECAHWDRPDQVVSISTSPLMNAQGRFFGAVILISDETLLDTLEKELTARQQFHTMIGKSVRMQKIYSLVESLAKVDTTVLITGESGTGKELVAEAVHFKGARSEKPLVKVNCSALTESLLESELFGHVKGAFTGAMNDRAGRFQTAEGGTIFLDEIGDISPALQLRLLKVLQNKEIERVGDSIPINVDVRVLAATNRDLRKLMQEGKFREDLYYRIKVVEIHAPPLRERRDDIPVLAEHFIRKLNAKLRRNVESVSKEVLKVFMAHDWPGNVRELEHTLEHALIVCQKNIVTMGDLPADMFEQMGSLGPSLGIKEDSLNYSGGDERQRILNALEKAAWNKAKAARLLGISRRTIYRKMQEHNIQEADKV